MADHKILFTSGQIHQRVKELAAEIARDYQDKNILLIGILSGASIFTADLLRELYNQGINAEIDFMTAASYGNQKISSEKITITRHLTQKIENKEVIIVEDIIDTGRTLSYLKKDLQAQNPKSLKIVALLDKKECRLADIQADYVGFTLKGKPWIEGYGLDTASLGRGRPDIITRSK